MYGGEIVEDQPAADMVGRHHHPYSAGLLGSYADPRDELVEVAFIPGRPPDLSRDHAGCLFQARCPVAVDACRTRHPDLVPAGRGAARCLLVDSQDTTAIGPTPGDLARRRQRDAVFAVDAQSRGAVDAEPVLVVDDVSKTYRVRRNRRTTVTQAVDGVSFALRPGRVSALVGQSGSGKTTLARLVTGVERPTSGEVRFGDTHVERLGRRALRRYRRHVQLVFQDPFSALNPTRTVAYAIGRPLRNHLRMDTKQARDRAAELLETVGLSPASAYLDKLPHQLSGGQRQRVVIARALASEPEVLVADEPISMLDVSIRAEIVDLLDRLVRERGIAMLYITHDLLSARLLADDVMVLNKGVLVEQGDVLDVIRSAEDPYTQTLLAAIPRPGPAPESAPESARESAQPGGPGTGEPARGVERTAAGEEVVAPVR
jgi:peptide/nickel transport system ATP-binding protein